MAFWRYGGVLFAISSAACWGFGTVMSRLVIDQIPPITLLGLQLLMSVFFLGGVLVMRVRPRFAWADLRLGLPGMLEPGVAYLVGLIGLSWTSASNATLIGALEPLFVIALAWLLLRERVGRQTIILAGVAVAGVMLVTGSAEGSIGRLSLVGDLLVVAGTAIAALYVIVASRLSAQHDPLYITFLQQLVGLLLVGVVWAGAAAWQHPYAALPTVSLQYWVIALFSGVVQYAVAFWCYVSVLQRMPATQAGLFLTLIPVFGVSSAVLILHEQLGLWQLIGASAIVVALVLHARSQAAAATHTVPLSPNTAQ